jgi:hypothetical protein
VHVNQNQLEELDSRLRGNDESFAFNDESFAFVVFPAQAGIQLAP